MRRAARTFAKLSVPIEEVHVLLVEAWHRERRMKAARMRDGRHGERVGGLTTVRHSNAIAAAATTAAIAAATTDDRQLDVASSSRNTATCPAFRLQAPTPRCRRLRLPSLCRLPRRDRLLPPRLHTARNTVGCEQHEFAPQLLGDVP